MKDLDTKFLSEMYDNMVGIIPRRKVLVMESSKSDENLLLEKVSSGLNDNTGYISYHLVEFVKHDIESGASSTALDTKADMILENIRKTTTNPMISRVLKQYSDVSPTSQAQMLYKLLVL